MDLLQHAPLTDPWGSLVKEEKMDEDWSNKLDQLRRKHNLLDENRPFGLPPSLHYYGYYTLYEYEKLYGLGNPFVHDLWFSYLPELAKKMAEERVEYEKRKTDDIEGGCEGEGSSFKDVSQVSTDPDNTEGAELPNSEDSKIAGKPTLKIPSYKPASPSSDDVTKVKASTNEEITDNVRITIGETLKDIIAKTITKKMKSRTQVNEPAQEIVPLYSSQSVFPGMPFTEDSVPAVMPVVQAPTTVPSVPTVQPAKKQKMSPKEARSVNNGKNSKKAELSSSDEEKPAKKTRPKRGQYRKYNAQLLLEAVKAVQRGEMSVHRAGSYFGVPHSTLEYKVKERHLLRQKKVRESKEPKKATQTKTKNTDKASVTKVEEPASPSADSSVLSSGAFLPGLPAIPWLPLGQGYPMALPNSGLAGYGFSASNSASELLKRLQQKVQAKSDGVPASGPSSIA